MIGGYHTQAALSGLWREKWVNFLCVFNIAVGMFLVAMAGVGVYNVEVIASRLSERFAVSAFLADDIGEQEIKYVMAEIKSMPGVKSVKYISKDEALKELKAGLKDADYVLKGLEHNPLPPTITVSLEEGSVADDPVGKLAREIKAINGVQDVDYGKRLLRIIQSVRRNVRLIGGILIGALTAAMTIVSYATVKILFYRKRDEIETLKLLGATKGFMRTPFVIEGALIGLLGGGLASGGTLLVMAAAYRKLSGSIPMLGSIEAPVVVAAALPPLGLVLGFFGALMAIGRIKF